MFLISFDTSSNTPELGSLPAVVNCWYTAGIGWYTAGILPVYLLTALRYWWEHGSFHFKLRAISSVFNREYKWMVSPNSTSIILIFVKNSWELKLFILYAILYNVIFYLLNNNYVLQFYLFIYNIRQICKLH